MTESVLTMMSAARAASPNSSNLERNGAVAVDEPVAEVQLDQSDEHVDGDERVGDDGDSVAIGIVIPEREYHVGSSACVTGLLLR